MSPVTKKPSAVISKIHSRPGEGHSVDIVINTADGNENVGYMDMGSLPVPDRRFACDAVGFKVLNTDIQLFFAQSKPVGNGWLSLLVLNMGFESVRQFLKSAPSTFADNFLSAYKNQLKAVITDFKEPADQTVILAVSIVLTGYSGTNGCMDFYYASPFSQQQMATVRKLSVEPVVRINLPSPLVFAIIESLRTAEKQFPNLSGGE